MSTPDRLPELIDVATLAKYLGVDVRHIRRLTHERRIPFITWGHLVRFDPVDVAAWLQRRRHEGRRPPVWPSRQLAVRFRPFKSVSAGGDRSSGVPAPFTPRKGA